MKQINIEMKTLIVNAFSGQFDLPPGPFSNVLAQGSVVVNPKP